MNRKSLLVVLLALVVFLPACSLNKVTPKGVDNEAIELEIRTKLTDDIDLKAFQIDVDVNDGVVTLSGHVDNASQKAKATEEAQEVDGVKSVINNLHVGAH